MEAKRRHPNSRTPLVRDTWRKTRKDRHPESRTPPPKMETPLARAGNTWRETSEERHLESGTPPAVESQTGRQVKRDQWREASRDPETISQSGTWREPRKQAPQQEKSRESGTSSQSGRRKETERSKEKHLETQTQLTQLCNPKAVTVSNSRLRGWGIQLEDNWITTSSRQLGNTWKAIEKLLGD